MDINNECGELGIAITAKKQDMHYGTEAIHVYEKCGFVKYDENAEEFFV